MAHMHKLPWQRYRDSEKGTVIKSWQDRLSVALVYPNTYSVGMSNLGFQSVYHCFNRFEDVVCERAFLPDSSFPSQHKNKSCQKTRDRILTIESGRRITDFEVIAFSISFENDFINLLTLLLNMGLPFYASERSERYPLLVAGGVACMLNPEPIAPFMDCFLLGEGEVLVPAFVRVMLRQRNRQRQALLEILSTDIDGAYAPEFYNYTYFSDGKIKAMTANKTSVPKSVKSVKLADMSLSHASSEVLTPHTTFANTHLIEVSRGCPHGCRFCSAGFIYRPPRFQSIQQIEKSIQSRIHDTGRIGFVGAAVSDHVELIAYLNAKNVAFWQTHQEGVRLMFSSLRADALTDDLISLMVKSQVNLATIAPEAGSQRMRRIINKGLSEEDILAATEALVQGGIPNLRLYFMIGLPFEEVKDVDAIVALVRKIKAVFLDRSRSKGYMGKITISINPFVPKPLTPFQWAGMAPLRELKQKLTHIRSGLSSVPNIKVQAENLKSAYWQALFTRGDRRVSPLLERGALKKENLNQILKSAELDPGMFVERWRGFEEILPWDFINHGISKSFLVSEYLRAEKEQTFMDCPMTSCSVCGVCERKT